MTDASVNDGNLPHVVIVGCGFGGLFAAKTFAKKAVHVTVIDRTNHHLFQPLLYQVATAALSAPAIAAPIRHILAGQKNVIVIYGEVGSIDIERRIVALDHGEEICYDYLIVATGSTSSYFGHDQWKTYAPSLKTLDDAFEIRRRVLLAFEHAERELDSTKRAAWLTFVVIGGGATGVELAGALAEISRHTLRGEFRRFDPGIARIVLIEAGEQVLPSYPASLTERARSQLERLGVSVWLEKRVTSIDAAGVQLGDDRIDANTVVWAAGVAASPLGKHLNVPLDRSGRVIVEADLAIPGHAEVMVIGDLAAMPWHSPSVPGIAPAAKQMGGHAANNILRALNRQKTKAFKYRDYGMLATIGRNSAVATFGKLKISGYAAWLMWLLAHIWFLIGFRNRLMLILEWAWAYWTFQRNARIVSGSDTAPSLTYSMQSSSDPLTKPSSQMANKPH